MALTLCSSFKCFYLLNGWRYIDFQIGHFPDFKQFGHFGNLERFTIDSHFSYFMHVKIDHLYYFEQALVVLLSMGKTSGHTKQSEASLFDNKFKNHT